MQSSSSSRFQSSVTSGRTRKRGEFLAAAESSSSLAIQLSCTQTKQVPLAYVLEPSHLHAPRTSQSLQKRNRADRVLGWVTKKGTRLTEF